jgi:hypothetical protein
MTILIRVKHLIWSRDFLLVCLKPCEQFLSYVAAVTISGDNAANLDLCLALVAFNSDPLKGTFTFHTFCDMECRFIRSHPKDQHLRPTVGFVPAKQRSRRKDHQMLESEINCLLVCLITALRLAQEFFTYMESSPLLVKGCKI